MKSYDNSESDTDDVEGIQPQSTSKDARVKAAKKALKKAKKEARKKIPEGDSSSSTGLLENSSSSLETSLHQKSRKRKVSISSETM